MTTNRAPRPATGASDEGVALRVLPGGDDASRSLDAIYRRYCRYVGAVILRLDGRAVDLEDRIQDVFAEAAQGLESLRQPEAIKGWLATIAVRLVRKQLRRRRLRRFLWLDNGGDTNYADLADPGASPVDKLLVTEVYRVLDDVSVDDRLAFSLHHIEGETLQSVAKLCGCSLATTKRRIARAHRVLTERLPNV